MLYCMQKLYNANILIFCQIVRFFVWFQRKKNTFWNFANTQFQAKNLHFDWFLKNANFWVLNSEQKLNDENNDL